MSASAALGQAGGLVCWGTNDFGESVPPDGKFVRAAAGWHFSLAINTDGQIVHWGRLQFGVGQVPSGTGFVEVSAGYDHGIALRADGSIVAWGGIGSEVYPPGTQGTVPVEQDVVYTAVSAGEAFNLALRANGSIKAWGWPSSGQLEVPDNDPTQPGFVPYIMIKAGGHHGVGLRADGSVRAWGGTGYGSGTQGILPAGTNAPGMTYIAVGAGHYETYLITSNRELIQWGGAGCQGHPPEHLNWKCADGGYKHGYGLTLNGRVYAWVHSWEGCDPGGAGQVPTFLHNATVALIAPGNCNFHNIVIVP